MSARESRFHPARITTQNAARIVPSARRRSGITVTGFARDRCAPSALAGDLGVACGCYKSTTPLGLIREQTRKSLRKQPCPPEPWRPPKPPFPHKMRAGLCAQHGDDPASRARASPVTAARLRRSRGNWGWRCGCYKHATPSGFIHVQTRNSSGQEHASVTRQADGLKFSGYSSSAGRLAENCGPARSACIKKARSHETDLGCLEPALNPVMLEEFPPKKHKRGLFGLFE